MGNSSINGGNSIAKFDYQRAHLMTMLPSLCRLMGPTEPTKNALAFLRAIHDCGGDHGQGDCR